MVVVDVVDDLVLPGCEHLVPFFFRFIVFAQFVDGVAESLFVCGIKIFVDFLPKPFFLRVFFLLGENRCQNE